MVAVNGEDLWSVYIGTGEGVGTTTGPVPGEGED